MAKVPMTKAGHDALIAEANSLTRVDLPAIIEKVAEARANGDLKENAEYHAAREKQGFIQDRIKYIEDQLSDAFVIENSGDTDTIMFGATVVTIDLEDDEEEEFTLVGQDEADPAKDMISVTSPFGKALLGKKAGDEVEFETPGGIVNLKIVSFE